MSAARFVAAVSSWSPSLSPDGRRLAYVSDTTGCPRLFVSDLDGGNERQVDAGTEPVQEVHWSVDGEWLALSIAPGGSPRTEVWAVRPSGDDLRKIPSGSGGACMLGPWSHRASVLCVSRTTQPTAGVALLHDVATGVETPIAGGGQPIVLDVDRSDADLGTLDSLNARERGKYCADAVLTGHPIDANVREHDET